MDWGKVFIKIWDRLKIFPDTQRNYYLLFSSIMFLQVLDVLTTFLGLTYGFIELNRIMVFFMDKYNFYLFGLLKLISMFLLIKYWYGKSIYRIQFLTILYIITAAVVNNNILQLIIFEFAKW